MQLAEVFLEGNWNILGQIKLKIIFEKETPYKLIHCSTLLQKRGRPLDTEVSHPTGVR